MNAPKADRKLPRELTFGLLFGLCISGLVFFLSVSETVSLAQLSELKHAKLSKIPWLDDTAALEGAMQAQIRALEGMRGARILTVGALALFSGMGFVGAARLLRPKNLPREGVRRMTAGAFIAAGFLRTIDGAQWAVIARRMASTIDPRLLGASAAQASSEQLKQLMPSLVLWGVIAQTALVAGAFVFLSQYLRSERVKRALEV